MIAGGSKCVFAGGHNGECGGRIRWHHPVTKNRLKRAFPRGAWQLDGNTDFPPWQPIGRHGPPTDADVLTRTLSDILGDTRNQVWICDVHSELGQLPDSAQEFCREFGLVWEGWDCDNETTTNRGGTAQTARPRHHETRS